MSTINKLVAKMITVPCDFREADLDRVMTHFRYVKMTASGSGIKYVSTETDSMINFHHPHRKGGATPVKPSTMRDVISELKREGKIPCVT